jgi:hypothetical protein
MINSGAKRLIQTFVAVRWKKSNLYQFSRPGDPYKQFCVKAKKIAMSPAGT